MRGRLLPGRVRVRLPPGGPVRGDVAQLAERLTLTQDVVGSKPAVPAKCDVSLRRNWMRGTVLTCRLRVRLPPG